MKQPAATSNNELRELIRRHGMSVEGVAGLINRDLKHIYRWLGDENPPMPGYLQALLRERLDASRS